MSARTALFLVALRDTQDLIVEARSPRDATRIWREWFGLAADQAPHTLIELPPTTGRTGPRPWGGLTRWAGAHA